MKVTVEIPDWAIGKPIYVVAGRELLAYQQPIVAREDHSISYTPLKVKTRRCEGCGVCCQDCVFLQTHGCPFGDQIPLGCAISDCSWIEECTEEFK
jgi:hypothetical protein